MTQVALETCDGTARRGSGRRRSESRAEGQCIAGLGFRRGGREEGDSQGILSGLAQRRGARQLELTTSRLEVGSGWSFGRETTQGSGSKETGRFVEEVGITCKGMTELVMKKGTAVCRANDTDKRVSKEEGSFWKRTLALGGGEVIGKFGGSGTQVRRTVPLYRGSKLATLGFRGAREVVGLACVRGGRNL